MSVKKILVCDRHGGEHPAVTTVWMKWAGMPRIRRWDVCAEGFELITGVPMNGRPALPAPLAEPSDARRRGIGTTAGSDTAKLMRGFEAFLAKTKRRFALDEAAQSISTAGLKHTKNPGDMLKRLNPIIRGMIRTKGQRSSSRAYPVTKS